MQNNVNNNFNNPTAYWSYSSTKGSDMQQGSQLKNIDTKNLNNSPQPQFMGYTIQENDTEVNSLDALFRNNLRIESNPEI